MLELDTPSPAPEPTDDRAAPPRGDRRYRTLRTAFRWDLPERYNIASACADAYAAVQPDRLCLIEDRGAEPPLSMTYGTLARRARDFAAGLARRGVVRGTRVAIVLPQSFEAAIAHLAVYRLGAIAVPLALRFGPDALGFRLRKAGVCVVVTNEEGLATLSGVPEALPDLAVVIAVSGSAAGVEAFEDVERGGEGREAPLADTGPDDPALLIFTSGTTGAPKGALHGHRVLLGHLPGMRFHHEDFPQARDRLWTPSDWAWAGGLLNALLPSLALGVPVVFTQARFEAGAAFELMARQKVRNAFLPATALRMLKGAASPDALAAVDLRTIGSAGETLPAATQAWAAQAFGIGVNEFYGQTECNMVLGSSAAFGISTPGWIGRAVPGHEVAIVSPDGAPLPAGEVGTIAVLRPDPVMFLSYLDDPEATAAKFRGDWLMTGDQAVMNEVGDVRFVGRDDDLITSAGYRIGPGEVEDCLMAHPAVQFAAVVGKPDPVRTEIVKAYIVPVEGTVADDTLATGLKRFVRERLSAHEYPREIGFVDSLPLTTSGKIVRRTLRERARAEAEAAAVG